MGMLEVDITERCCGLGVERAKAPLGIYSGFPSNGL